MQSGDPWTRKDAFLKPWRGAPSQHVGIFIWDYNTSYYIWQVKWINEQAHQMVVI